MLLEIINVKVDPEFNSDVNQSPLRRRDRPRMSQGNTSGALMTRGCQAPMLCVPILPMDRGYDSGPPVGMWRDGIRREATGAPTHLRLQPLTSLCNSSTGRYWKGGRLKATLSARSCARIWAENSPTPTHTPARVLHALHKEALHKSELNDGVGVSETDAETIASAAKKNAQGAFVFHQNIPSFVNGKKMVNFWICY